MLKLNLNEGALNVQVCEHSHMCVCGSGGVCSELKLLNLIEYLSALQKAQHTKHIQKHKDTNSLNRQTETD